MACLPLLFAVGIAAGTANAGISTDPWSLCAAETGRFERQMSIPAHLLNAIARVESGRWSAESSQTVAWPWTVTAEGKGRFLPSKAAAIAEVRRLQAKGVKNIDIGCMQVNLKHHPRAFDSLEEGFEPQKNVAYAAEFLKKLRVDANSWTRAIGHYHSQTPVFSNRYRRKVLHSWRETRHEANRIRRLNQPDRLERRQGTGFGASNRANPRPSH